MKGKLSIASCEKAASFICLCDSFNIPLVFLIDVPGMFPGSAAEKQKLPGKIVNRLETEPLGRVPKISITLRKAYGMGWNVMMSPGEGADFVAAWPIASISFVDPVIGIEMVHGSKIAEALDIARGKKGPLISEHKLQYRPTTF